MFNPTNFTLPESSPEFEEGEWIGKFHMISVWVFFLDELNLLNIQEKFTLIYSLSLYACNLICFEVAELIKRILIF